MNSKSKNIKFYYEKVKAILLVCLIILCIVQIGILWSNQSYSSPISLFSNSNSKNSSPVSIDDTKGEYLLPYRIAISTGFDGEHYVIPNGSKEYTTLWNGARQYIDQALETKPQKIQPFNEDDWGTLVANKPYTFEFKTQIPIDIIKWTLNMEDSEGEGLSGIYKLVICPDDSDNSYADTLYVRDDKNIYIYSINSAKNDILSYSVFNEIYTKQKSDINSKSYQMAIEKYRKFEISKDLLSVFSGKRQDSYPDFICEPISGLDKEEYSYDDFYDMALDLFGNARIDYDFDVDVNGSVVFKKADGVYRLYKNSILEYKYTGNQTNIEELNVLEAYKKALSYLLESRSQNDIMSNITVYLSSIDIKQGSYIFNFDYSISLGEENGEVPILLKDYKIPNSDNQLLSNGISIEASSKKVISFKWLALKFYVDNNIENYEWSFVDMYSKMYDKYSELKNEFSAKDFGIYYVLKYPQMQENIITPSFVLFTKDGVYDILMEANK
ncbi:hypothetical protein LY28_02315 [Ruminiclostridium sufflavum DSM 19573]|uniref:Regulatory protein YycH of two-component signal transduction system YycFG n=1 Tax=Ruminiclostridium sufflavum DSM 19573 TaxID=1121337 RepID=A0A318XNM5_9FIRM|nr:hypothetical protein [Ruminiclostridium sufflavum]PYG87179.1 hypothetical protein LY28_02315 [Ruminiclostridium sufflavum DSM 19573]